MQEKDIKNEQVLQQENTGQADAAEETTVNVNKMPLKDLRIFAQALIEENTRMDSEMQQLTVQAETLKKVADKAAQLSNMYTSIQKDFDMYKTRNKDVEKTSYDSAVAEIGLKIVPVYENLKRAIDAVPDEKSKEGVYLIYKQFAEVLSSLGIEEIQCEGEVFDPYKHSAVMAVDTDEDALKGKVKQVYSGGYIYKDKVIRQSQVIAYKT